MVDVMLFDVPQFKRSRHSGTLTLASASDPAPSTIASVYPTGINYDESNNQEDLPDFFQDDQWQDVFVPIPIDVTLENSGEQTSQSRKRRRSPSLGPIDLDGASEAAIWFRNTFPELVSDVLQLPERSWAPEIVNPFLDEATLKHPRLRSIAIPVVIPQDGYINGLIKIRLNLGRYKQTTQPIARLQKFPWKKPRYVVPLIEKTIEGPARLPPDFGRALNLSGITEKLFEFYRIAICGGVTLIPNENCYLREIIPIAVKSECVKHAILALAATYILDYSGEENVKTQANLHWKRAVHLLSRELMSTESCKPGKENAVVAAMALFSHNENVNWEAGEAAGVIPPWYKATHLAERVLERSDPLYNFQSPSNVQTTRARIQLGNKIALYNIMSATASPLELDQTKCSFSWLIEGDEPELRRIVGCTGLSPRLMHTYAQITHLSAKLYKDPRRPAARKLGRVIGNRLQNFWQWSDLSNGFPTTQALIDSCELDENGKVFTATKTTELVAESFAAAAQVYLYCRMMRKSRRHPCVQEVLDKLLWLIDRMPTSGPFFTGQHAQLRVFLAAVVAVEERHRAIIRTWFTDLVNGTRGNVPPVWRTVQFMWGWLDEKLGPAETAAQDASDINSIDPDAAPWWEDLVAEIYKREGMLNLA